MSDPENNRLIDMTEADLMRLVKAGVRAELAGFERPAPDLPVYMTSADVAKHFGVSDRTVRSWIARGCPARNIGGAAGWRLRLAEVEAWLDRNSGRAAG